MRKNSKLRKLLHYGCTVKFFKQKRPECPFKTSNTKKLSSQRIQLNILEVETPLAIKSLCTKQMIHQRELQAQKHSINIPIRKTVFEQIYLIESKLNQKQHN